MADEAANPKFEPTVRYSPEALERARQLVDDIPEQIGPYRILERIGHGGMGDVYRAEQRSPIRREVALKFIKLGMDTKAVIARFEAERQALAMMDHPHIAKVFDAGADDLGRPYFVMEYVKGLPITDYADAKRLTIPQRLRLFEQVCQAIQHAHHKGVIHRDIKPSNVLVSTQDDQPFAKVIDFGVAKALSQQLTDKTLFTRHDQFIGTPQYMSPEQAEGSLDIDTRSDVYSLGVLLYELLSGSPPFNASELKLAAFDQLKKLIREVDPPAPSLRLSQSGPTLPQIATNRQSDVRRLGPLVRGELDWIVMKALEKDRRRRYETPTSLASDIQAHLKGEAIQAAPPSKLYQLQKLLRRHKGPVITIAAVMLALLLGIAGTTWGFYRAAVAQLALQQTNSELERQSDQMLDGLKGFYRRSAMEEARELSLVLPGRGLTSENILEAESGLKWRVTRTGEQFDAEIWMEGNADPAAFREELTRNVLGLIKGQWDYFIDERDKARRHFVRSLLGPIGYAQGLPKDAEWRIFREWSKLEPLLKTLAVDEALSNPDDALRIASRSEYILQSAIGLSPTQRQVVIQRILAKLSTPDSDPRVRIAAGWFALELGLNNLPDLSNAWTVILRQPITFEEERSLAGAFADTLVRSRSPAAPAVAEQFCLSAIHAFDDPTDVRIHNAASEVIAIIAPVVPTHRRLV